MKMLKTLHQQTQYNQKTVNERISPDESEYVF